MPVELSYYDILGVLPDAELAEINRAFRTLSAQCKADRKQLEKLTRAHDVLADEQRRSIYDQLGDDKRESQSPTLNSSELFDRLFPDVSSPFPLASFEHSAARRRGRDIVHILPVTLSELYNGTLRTVTLSRMTQCDCVSSPNRSRQAACAECAGTGVSVSHIVCGSCKGRGVRQRPGTCQFCADSRLISRKHSYEVRIEPGMKDGERIVFEREGDEQVDGAAGDVVIKLQQRQHETFRREGNDLYMSATISLKDALCGVSIPILHLDGRSLTIKSPIGEVISPGETKSVPNEGMPVRGHAHSKGDLFVKFCIEFPKRVNPEMVHLLSAALSPSDNQVATSCASEEVFLQSIANSPDGDDQLDVVENCSFASEILRGELFGSRVDPHS
eukprot:TRINITY_DN44_c0_g1_i1.p1 TRINITY_DN44_c0_g1~~TRINITY_DN44_c0_g1_i1.p1  ORF type:complete len:388 (-),score=42.91 TRINITY_DN44_c0_g1_i1:96-1259(-)